MRFAPKFGANGHRSTASVRRPEWELRNAGVAQTVGHVIDLQRVRLQFTCKASVLGGGLKFW